MKYIFIENSKGVMFANNNYLDNVTCEVKKYNNMMDLISEE